jgi:hypothetical protein
MSVFTKTPVNAVLFCATGSIGLGSMVFASPIATQRINVVLFIAVTALRGQNIAYLIPIASCGCGGRKTGGYREHSRSVYG